MQRCNNTSYSRASIAFLHNEDEISKGLGKQLLG